MRILEKFVVAIVIVFVFTIALPAFIRARTTSSCNACINNLRQFDGAKQQWALEHNKTTNDVPSLNDMRLYVKLTSSGELPGCPNGGRYTLGRVDESPRCSVMVDNMDFGYVSVIDQSGLPLADTQIIVRGAENDIVTAITSTNGAAYLLNDRDVWQSVRWSNSWSDGTKQIFAGKEGYSTNRVALPTSYWPVRFVLKKEKN
jgi:hypothetical protein